MQIKRRGLSLVELIISVAIIGTCLILVIGLFTMMLRTSQKSIDLTSGTVICDGLLVQQENQILNATKTARNAFFTFGYATPMLLSTGNYGLNDADFFYQMYVQDVVLPGFSLANVTTNGSCNLKRLDATVWWFTSAPGQGRQGYGMLRVQQSKLLWPTANK